ncbi:hypothetical protein ACIBH1_38085 [Nonomuraea sp. NPDC050663]|uniref:hypothetical protein n=1 Tax=Nonomuraea sp. NPDC050663 TaxID=3364370 RepID=UPI0037B768CB
MRSTPSGGRRRLAALMIGLSVAGVFGATVSAPAHAQPRDPYSPTYQDWFDEDNWEHGQVYYEDGAPFIISLCYNPSMGLYNCPRWL